MADATFDEIKTMFNRAHDLLTHGAYNQAIEGFQKVLDVNPKSAEALLNLGNAHFYQRNYDKAIEYFKKALDIDSTLVKAYSNLGSSYFKLEKYNDAIGYWLISSNIRPDSSTTHQNLGVAYEKLGLRIKAFKHYEEFIKYNRKNDTNSNKIKTLISEGKRVAYHNLETGVKYQKQGKYAKAAIAYIKAIEAYPNISKLHLNLGSIYYMNDKIINAIESWEQAIRLDPDHANTHCNLAIAYDKSNEPNNALYHYIRYLEITHGSTNDAGTVKSRTEQLKKILNDKNELIKQHLNKGNDLYKDNYLEEALEELQKYITLSPNASDAMVVRKKIETIKSKLNPIEKALEIAIKMGDEYMQAAKYDKALTAYKRYLSLNSKGLEASNVRKKIDVCTKHISSVISAMLKSD